MNIKMEEDMNIIKYCPKEMSELKHGIELEFISPFPMNKTATLLTEKTGIKCPAKGYTHRYLKSWKIVSDSSVAARGKQEGYGMELVSPPLNIKDFKKQLPKFCVALKEIGCFINNTCGFHVHHDISFIPKKYFGVFAIRLLDSFMEFEKVFDTLVSPSRIKNGYCRSLVEYDKFTKSPEEVGFCKKREKLVPEHYCRRLFDNYWDANIYDCSIRYSKLNIIESLLRHKTIEFRQHQGTLEFNKIYNWILLTELFLRRCLESNIEKRVREHSLKEFFEWLQLRKKRNKNEMDLRSKDIKNVYTFYNKRYKELNEKRSLIKEKQSNRSIPSVFTMNFERIPIHENRSIEENRFERAERTLMEEWRNVIFEPLVGFNSSFESSSELSQREYRYRQGLNNNLSRYRNDINNYIYAPYIPLQQTSTISIPTTEEGEATEEDEANEG